MKKILSVVAVVVVCAAVAIVATARDKVITAAELPAKAQTFIKTYFPKSTPAIVKQDKEAFSTDYEVVYPDGAKVEFDGNGNWKEVKCLSGIPAKIIPAQISAYLKSNGYVGNGINVVKIDVDRKGYEVELSNGMELEFNRQYQLIDIDN